MLTSNAWLTGSKELEEKVSCIGNLFWNESFLYGKKGGISFSLTMF